MKTTLSNTAPVGPKCRCGHNARWHGPYRDCLAVLCDCETYVPRYKEKAVTPLQESELRGAA